MNAETTTYGGLISSVWNMDYLFVVKHLFFIYWLVKPGKFTGDKGNRHVQHVKINKIFNLIKMERLFFILLFCIMHEVFVLYLLSRYTVLKILDLCTENPIFFNWNSEIFIVKKVVFGKFFSVDGPSRIQICFDKKYSTTIVFIFNSRFFRSKKALSWNFLFYWFFLFFQSFLERFI
jgi:hypothetical protein